MAAQLRKRWEQPEWACLFCKVIWKHKNVYLMSDTFVEILALNTFNFFIGSVDLQMN